MASAYLILAIINLLPCIYATSVLKTTPYPNVTTSALSGVYTDSACCFAVLDEVKEAWWFIYTTVTTTGPANITSITTLITVYPNVTHANFETNIYPTIRLYSYSRNYGVNPISFYNNPAPGPAQITEKLNGTAVVTGGVTVQSPAAFYVYSTVRIITVAPVTDEYGRVVCGTASSFSQSVFSNSTGYLPTFTNINSNAEAYFGGVSILREVDLPTSTDIGTDISVVVDKSGSTFTETNMYTKTFFEIVTEYTAKGIEKTGNTTSQRPTGVIISLTTPFIYQPKRGATGEIEFGSCSEGEGAENYGYVPQTFLDFLISNSYYSMQYPGLESCLPGGPTMLNIWECDLVGPVEQSPAPDLTHSTVIYITPTDNAKSTLKAASAANVPSSVKAASAVNTRSSLEAAFAANTPSPLKAVSAVNAPSSSTYASNLPVPSNDIPVSSRESVLALQATDPNQSLATRSSASVLEPFTVVPSPGISPGEPQSAALIATTIPVIGASSGLGETAQIIGGAPFSTISSPTIIATPSPPAASVSRTTVISGRPLLIVPVASAPSSLGGLTTTLDGTPFLVVPSPTEGPTPPTTSPLLTASLIKGTPFLIVPVAGAPSSLGGVTTTLDGTPFLVVPSPTLATAPSSTGPLFTTSLIKGTPYLIVPVTGAPSGLGGITTTLDGTPFLAVPSPATMAAPLFPASSSFSTTVINGTPFLVIGGSTTDLNAPLQGSTTVISGTTMVVMPGGTTASSESPPSSYVQASAAAGYTRQIGVQKLLIGSFARALIVAFCLAVGMGSLF